MVKILEIRPKEVEKILLKLGFTSRSGKGSHKVFKHKDGRRTVIPMHSRPIRFGTLRAILKQVNIEASEFLELL